MKNTTPTTIGATLRRACCVLCGSPQIEHIGVLQPRPGQPGPRAIEYYLCSKHPLEPETFEAVDRVVYGDIARCN